jgi:RND family efflux transporter MFP subunit
LDCHEPALVHLALDQRTSIMMKICRVLATLAVAGVAVSGCSKSQTTQARGNDEPEKKIETEAVRQETVRRAIQVVGTLAAEDQVNVSSQAEGVVIRVLVDLGDRVKTGQVLLELDKEKLEYNLDQQKAALARALARFGAADPENRPPIEETPDVKRTAAELRQAKQAYDRADELHKRQLVPRQALDDADATLRTKQATYESALQNAKNLTADIDASNAMLKLAARELRDASIRAPFDGYVQKRLVSIGEYVQSEAPVMSIVRVDPLKVIAEIPERMAPWIEVNQPVDLRVDAFPDKTFTGKVSRISPAVNPQTRAFPFEALVPNGDAQLKPGTFAQVHIETSLTETVLTIPYAALQYRYGVNRAFVVKDNRLAGRELKLGDRVGERIEILGGIAAGDLVALTDVDTLTDGLKVAPTSRQTE